MQDWGNSTFRMFNLCEWFGFPETKLQYCLCGQTKELLICNLLFAFVSLDKHSRILPRVAESDLRRCGVISSLD